MAGSSAARSKVRDDHQDLRRLAVLVLSSRVLTTADRKDWFDRNIQAHQEWLAEHPEQFDLRHGETLAFLRDCQHMLEYPMEFAPVRPAAA